MAAHPESAEREVQIAKVLRACSALLFEIGVSHNPKAGVSILEGSTVRRCAP
jgi:hypothetical protein